VQISDIELSKNVAAIKNVDEFDPDISNNSNTTGISVGAELSVTVPINATEGDGTVQGTVSIPGTLGNDFVVLLSSSDTTEATVPATLTIPAGQTSATFDVTIMDDSAVDGNQAVTITASAGGWTSGSDEIDVLDDEGPLCECPGQRHRG